MARVRLSSVLDGIFRALAADELGAGARGSDGRTADLLRGEAHKHGHAAQVHADERQTHVQPRVGLDALRILRG